jgi:hypothetical protein
MDERKTKLPVLHKSLRVLVQSEAVAVAARVRRRAAVVFIFYNTSSLKIYPPSRHWIALRWPSDKQVYK